MAQPPIQDPETGLTQIVEAVVYTTSAKRSRFPENCVEVCTDESAALSQANPKQKRFAARLHGPCRSSEGFRLYYLIEWLGEAP